jgi:hypothetical protein
VSTGKAHVDWGNVGGCKWETSPVYSLAAVKPADPIWERVCSCEMVKSAGHGAIVGRGLAHLAAARVDSRMRDGVPSFIQWVCESGRLSPAVS